MINKNPEILDYKSISRKVISLAVLAILSKIALGGANSFASGLVRERASGKCEGCGRHPKERLIAAHMDHTHNSDYNNPDKLKAYCLICEFKHHVNHLGRASVIGLSDEDNDRTTNGLYREIVRKSTKKELKQLNIQYKNEIRELHRKFGSKTKKKKRRRGSKSW